MQGLLFDPDTVYRLTMSSCFPGVDFLEQIKILQQPVSTSVSESVLSLSLGIMSSGSFILYK